MMHACFEVQQYHTLLALATGVPQGEEDSRQLAVALYPAMLRALPASIMSWFGRLNNRAIETAIEVHTTKLHIHSAAALHCSSVLLSCNESVIHRQ